MDAMRAWQQGVSVVLPVLMAGVLGGCSDSTASTLSAVVAAKTFSAPVQDIVARGADGTESRVAPDSDGGWFHLVLEQGTSYHIFVNASGLSVPLVLGGSHGSYVTELAVSSGGAKVDLGVVRYFAGESATSQDRSLVLLPLPRAGAAQCVDGYFSQSEEPCMGAKAEAVCSDDDDDEEDGDDDEHECENGLDALGNPCDGGPAANLDDEDGGHVVQVYGAVAVPELSFPGPLGCEDDDEDDDDDEEDDEGSHGDHQGS